MIIMDYHMPQMSGLDVIRQLQQNDSLSVIPVILFTSDRTVSLLGEAEELGVARVIHKPILPDQLIAVVQEVVDEAQSSKERE